MRKLFFIAMIVLGTSLVQAQNTFTVGFFTHSNGTSYLHVVDDFAACYEGYSSVSYDVYELAADGASYTVTDEDGVSSTVSIFQSARAEWATTFGGTLSFIRPVNASGNTIFGAAHDGQAKSQS